MKVLVRKTLIRTTNSLQKRSYLAIKLFNVNQEKYLSLSFVMRRMDYHSINILLCFKT
jgi:hypothetical protein